MLYWLLQSQSAHPELTRGEPPEGLLAPEEQIEFDQFTSPHRRRIWLLGRWTAKRLLQQMAEQRAGVQSPLHTIIIQTAKYGAPLTNFRVPDSGQKYSLSLSHKHDYALCAAFEGDSVPVGADLEWIEPRDPDFVPAFFNEDEQALVSNGADHLRNIHVTAIWSAKEAAFKATRCGANLDPHLVSCLIQPVAAEAQDWMPFEIVWHGEKSRERPLPVLAGWWQTIGSFVLTLALQAEM